MDHEYGTSALGADQVGWDWFSLQLDNQMEIMLFQIREKNGEISQFSSGSLINPAGQIENIKNEAFTIEVLDEWRDHHAVAPAGVGVEQIPAQALEHRRLFGQLLIDPIRQ